MTMEVEKKSNWRVLSEVPAGLATTLTADEPRIHCLTIMTSPSSSSSSHTSSSVTGGGHTARGVHTESASSDVSLPSGWCAATGFNFFVDSSTDDCGWQQVNSESDGQCDANDDNLRMLSQQQRQQQVRRRVWCRLVCASPAAADLYRDALRRYFAANSRGKDIKVSIFMMIIIIIMLSH